MRTYEVYLKISAECEADARELIEDFLGKETDIEICSIEEKSEIQESLESIRGIPKEKLHLDIHENDEDSWGGYYAILSTGEGYTSGLLWTQKEVMNELEILKKKYDISEVEQNIANDELIVLEIE